jgi:hypothetical protein
MLRPDDFVKGQLAMYGWQRGHPYGGHLASCAIMSTLANRQKLGWGTWLDVISNAHKYSATIEQPTVFPQIWDPGFVRVLHEVDGIYEGSIDYASGGVYWFDSALPVTHAFFQSKILNDPEVHKRVRNMNSLMFFI